MPHPLDLAAFFAEYESVLSTELRAIYDAAVIHAGDHDYNALCMACATTRDPLVLFDDDTRNAVARAAWVASHPQEYASEQAALAAERAAMMGQS